MDVKLACHKVGLRLSVTENDFLAAVITGSGVAIGAGDVSMPGPSAGKALLSRLAAVPGVLGVTGLRVPSAGQAQADGSDYPGKYPPFPVLGT